MMFLMEKQGKEEFNDNVAEEGEERQTGEKEKDEKQEDEKEEQKDEEKDNDFEMQNDFSGDLEDKPDDE